MTCTYYVYVLVYRLGYKTETIPSKTVLEIQVCLTRQILILRTALKDKIQSHKRPLPFYARTPSYIWTSAVSGSQFSLRTVAMLNLRLDDYNEVS